MRRLFLGTTGVLTVLTVWIWMVMPGLAQILFTGQLAQATAGNVPVGGIILIASGSCPLGYAEVTGLNGFMPRGTVASNSDVGSTAGSDTITPTATSTSLTFTGTAGTVPAQVFTGTSGTVPAQTFTGSSGTIPAQTFTGTAFSSVINHTHVVVVTDPGHTHNIGSANDISSTTGSGNVFAGNTNSVVSASNTTGVSATTNNPSGGVSTITPAGTNETVSFTPAGTNATVAFTPAGTNSTAAFTPAGTIGTPVITVASFNNRPAYMNIIFCSKT